MASATGGEDDGVSLGGEASCHRGSKAGGRAGNDDDATIR
jgi:hypothetical protein